MTRYLFFIIILIIIQYSYEYQYTDKTCIAPYCTCEEKSLKCDNFTSFIELDFKKTVKSFTNLLIKPKYAIKLNSALDLKGLKTNGSFKIIFQNINDVHLHENFFQSIENLKIIEFLDSDINKIHHPAHCKNGIFSNLNLLKFEFYNVNLNHKLCPGLFQNSVIGSFVLKDVDLNNVFERTSDTEERGYESNVVINDFKIQTDVENFEVMNKYIIEKVHSMEISAANLRYINENFFENLKNLKTLSFYKTDFNELIKNDGGKWMKKLNSKFSYNLNDPKFEQKNFENYLSIYVLSKKKIDFSDNNFCSFSNFPHKQLVFFYRDKFQEEVNECSCSIYWLYKYYGLYKNLNHQKMFLPINCLNVNNLDDRIRNCDLNRRVSKCLGEPYEEHESHDNDKIDKAKLEMIKNTNNDRRIQASIFSLVLLILFFIIF